MPDLDNLSTGYPIYNAYTPLAFLPPDLAYEVTISIYILVGSCGVFTWDLLCNFCDDLRLLTRHRIGWPTIVYFVSRLSAFGYVLGSTIFETAPTGNCAKFEKAVDWLFPVAVAFTSLLFFFRVRAIFDSNKFIVAFFALMWLAVLAGCLTVTQGVTGAHIGPTNYCINAGLQNYVQAAAIIPLVNDTLIFLSISWRLVQNSNINNTIKDSIQTLVFGVHMPSLSKSILQDGQFYYLTTVTTSMMTVIMLYIPGVPVSYRTMFTVPNVMLMNIMACRVFRNTKFGIFKEDSFSTTYLKSMMKEDRFVVPLSNLSTSGLGLASSRAGYELDEVKYENHQPYITGDDRV